MVATRYKGKVSAYEVWNEPNGKVFWDPEPDAAQYTELLKAAYPAIKAAEQGLISALLDPRKLHRQLRRRHSRMCQRPPIETPRESRYV